MNKFLCLNIRLKDSNGRMVMRENIFHRSHPIYGAIRALNPEGYKLINLETKDVTKVRGNKYVR